MKDIERDDLTRCNHSCFEWTVAAEVASVRGLDTMATVENINEMMPRSEDMKLCRCKMCDL